MKHTITAVRAAYIAALLLAPAALAAQEIRGYEFERNMPAFLDQIQEELTYPMAWGHSPITDFAQWRAEARRCVQRAMLAPPRRSKGWNMKVVAEEHRKGYTAKKIEFDLTAYSRVRAYLLIPDGKGPHPAVNILHDHGAHYTIGKEKSVRPFAVSDSVMADADKWCASLYDGQYLGDYLATHGYAVLSTDALFWGERGRKEGIDGNAHRDIAGHFQMLGRDWSAFINYEDVYATDFLASLPETDPERIGCAGCSMGAYRAWMLAALTDRIRAGAAVCWMTTTRSQLSWAHGREHGGFANCLPAVRQWLDYPHIASIACPKPMLFISGEQDKLFPAEAVKDAYATMRAVWDSQGASQNLETELWPMPHHCGLDAQKRVLDFFDRRLK